MHSAEEEMRRLWAASFGAGSTRQVDDLKVRWRANLIDSVSKLREGGMPSDPAGAWGVCVGQELQAARAETMGTPDKLAEVALQRCSEPFAAFERAKVAQLGKAEGDKQAALTRAEMRKRIIDILATDAAR